MIQFEALDNLQYVAVFDCFGETYISVLCNLVENNLDSVIQSDGRTVTGNSKCQETAQKPRKYR